mgnify:FL=1
MIPEEKTDGNIWRCLFSLRLIVNKEKPIAEITADRFPFQLPPPKSFQIIINTPRKAIKIDSKVLIDIASLRSIGDKMAVNIGAHANNRRAFAADVESKA